MSNVLPRFFGSQCISVMLIHDIGVETNWLYGIETSVHENIYAIIVEYRD